MVMYRYGVIRVTVPTGGVPCAGRMELNGSVLLGPSSVPVYFVIYVYGVRVIIRAPTVPLTPPRTVLVRVAVVFGPPSYPEVDEL